MSIRGQGPYRGFWSVTAHPVILEHAAMLGPDFVCIDLQHGADWSAVNINAFTALDRYGVAGVVRVPTKDPADIGRALDLGATGVMVPMVDSAEDAETVSAACRYPPVGTRSYGMQSPRSARSDEDPLCIVQVETVEALREAHAIANVDGVHWLYVGPADLGMSIAGEPGHDVVAVFEGSHPLAEDLLKAFSQVTEAATAANKLAGLHCGTGRGGAMAERHGFRVTSVATDVSAARRDMELQLREAQEGAGN